MASPWPAPGLGNPADVFASTRSTRSEEEVPPGEGDVEGVSSHQGRSGGPLAGAARLASGGSPERQ